MKDILTIGGKEFTSRLFVGTGKFASNRLMLESILASGSQMITVAMKRIDMQHEEEDDMLAHINRENVQFLPILQACATPMRLSSPPTLPETVSGPISSSLRSIPIQNIFSPTPSKLSRQLRYLQNKVSRYYPTFRQTLCCANALRKSGQQPSCRSEHP